MKLSVVIPGINEEKVLPALLESVLSSQPWQTIYVDGGSTDASVALAERFGVETAISLPGRAKQMNMGADLASGDTLLFVHADSKLPAFYQKAIEDFVSVSDNSAGVFSLEFEPRSFSISCIEAFANLRSRLFGLPYGDQGLFLRKEVFEKIGGFQDLPLLEDLDIIVRLRDQGNLHVSNDRLITSSRKYLRNGAFTTCLSHQIILLAWKFGVSEERLARLHKNLLRK